ncbi:hypothetical protein [Sphingomonas sp. PB4P5]
MTDRRSTSLGAPVYERLLEASGLQLTRCYEQENHFYSAIKPLQ